MKDATGELSMTAVAVVAIAAIAGLFGTIVWPQIRASITQNTYCNQAKCNRDNCDGTTCSCQYFSEETGQYEDVTCPDESASGIDAA